MAENTSIAPDRFDMRRFAQKIMKRPLLSALGDFKQTLNDMSHGQRERYFYQMVKQYKRLLSPNYRSIIKRISSDCALKEMAETFVDFLQIAGDRAPRRVVYLVRELKETLQVDSDFFLKLAPQNRDSELILSCVSGESWWDIRGSKLLMEDMMWFRERSFLLLKYGFPYKFDFKIGSRYIFVRFVNIRRSLLEKGKTLPEEISKKVLYLSQGSLRLQMAMDTLDAALTEVLFRKREIYSLMWKTVPHPFISCTEMFQLMSPLFTGYLQELQELCELYVKCHTVFDVPEVTSPRSLQHLSRVQLRRNLLNSNSLRDGVIDSLHIPRTIKAYLKLESF